MKFRRALLAIGVTLAIAPCSAWIRACLQDVPCFTGLTDPHMRALVIVTDVMLLGAFTGVAVTVRALWLIVKAVRATRDLPRQPWPRLLEESVIRTGARRVECIESAISVAFCAGALQPHIFVTTDLIRRLGAGEMDAVLLHENSHSRWRDPLWLGFLQAAADACFYVPLVTWLGDRARENAELRADRYAVRHIGRPTLARALCAAGTESMQGIAFSGAAELRAAQVLGDPLPPRRPALSLWLRSLAGLLSAFSLAWCVSQAVFIIW